MTEPVEPLAAGAVQQVDLMRVAVPLRLPFEASHGTETVREVVVVRVHGAGGEVGHGECDALGHPTYTHEYAAGAYALLRDEVVPALLAAGSTGTAGLDRWHPMARSGLVTARLDAALRAAGRPLAAVLGAPAGNDRLDRTVVLGRAGSIEQLGGWVDAAVASGAAMVKLKVAGPSDLRAAVMVRRAFPGLALAADANGALDGLDAGELRRAGLDELALRYLEQPYPPDELLALAELRRHGGTPICLDESITSPGAARVALAVGALDAVNVKPARLGGPDVAAAVLAWAGSEGVDAFCGGMLELGIGRAAAAAVAALPGNSLPTDLGPSAAYVACDITDPVVTDAAGRLVVPAGPGIGVEVDVAVLDAHTVEAVTLRRDR